MPDNVGSHIVTFVFHGKQTYLEVTPNISEVIRKGTDDWLGWLHFQRFKDLPIVISLKPLADSFAYGLAVRVQYPIKNLCSCWLSARQQKRQVAEG